VVTRTRTLEKSLRLVFNRHVTVTGALYTERLMPRARYWLIASETLVLVAACLMMICRPAAASIEYPALVKSYWGVKKLPVAGGDGCPLCHTTDPGMLGTANQKFAITLKSFGLQQMNDNALRAALDKNKSKMSDSDGDGYSDYEELTVYGTNPDDAQDHPAPMPTGSGGSGTGDSSAAGSTPDTAGASPAMDGTDGGVDVPTECQTSTEQIYPTLGHGCSFGAGSAGSNVTMLAGVLAACVLRRGARAGRGRRETLGKQL
jgi:hypothetical protein